jgi:cyanophycin synthetase
MGHIIEHVALELQTLAGMNTGWGRTRMIKGEKGMYNVVFNYTNEECGKLVAKEAVNVIKDIINGDDPQIEKIIKKLKPMTKKLNESKEKKEFMLI